MMILKEPLRQLQAYQYSHHGGAGRRREQGIENLFEKIMTENLPNLVKEIEIQVQEAQSFKQDEPKEVHTKIRHK